MSKAINLSGLKTLLEPLVHLINKKAECPDWNENDPSSRSYIAGRTHYETIEEQTINASFTIANGEVIDPFTISLVNGESYTIEWDGVKYNCVGYIAEGPNSPSIGNGTIVGVSGGNGEPFFIMVYNGQVMVFGENGDHTFSCSTSMQIIHKIDEKYLPEIKSVGKEGTGEGAEIFNNYEENRASGGFSHAEGYCTMAIGDHSHAEGDCSDAEGYRSHAEGYGTTASGESSHAEGSRTTASEFCAHAEGRFTSAGGDYSHAEGYYAKTTASGAHAEGYYSEASGEYAHAEGYQSISSGTYGSHAEGYATEATGQSSHAEGEECDATGRRAHAEGWKSKASGDNSHAEGSHTTANGSTSHAEGYGSSSSGNASHAEGIETDATGDYSHAEGWYATAASIAQHAQGKSNIIDSNNVYAHIVGNGSGDLTRSNAHTLDWSGNAWYAGDVYVGSTSGTNKDDGSKKLATEEYVDNALSNGSAPDASGQIEEHNTSSSAHNDIRSSVSNALNEAKSYTDSTLDTAKTYTNTKVAELVNSAPETLDTLGEVAAAIKANETVVDALNSAIGNKVDKVDGKGLSTNDYTTAEKNKLAGIEAGANAYSLPTASSSTLGGVKIGTGIGISSGVISNSGVRSISTGSTNGTISVNTNGTSAEVAVKGLGSNAYSSTAYLPLAGGTVTGVTTFSNTTASSSTTTGAVKISGGLGVAGNIYGKKVYGAVWNDYAEYRSQNEKIDAGYIVYCDDDGKLKLTTERLQKFEGVVSDTFGFAIGETDECQTPIAVSGRVLVYCNPEEHFHSGDCVCAGPDGLAYYMTREEIMEYPDRIVGIVSEIPTYEVWGSNNIKVNNRIWIRVR